MDGGYRKVKGFADIYGDYVAVFNYMENSARNIFSRYGFKELRTPILEFTDLFKRSIGDATDVVQKEMFTFPDRKGRSLTLRPEATAGVMRACIEDGLAKKDLITRLFTIGPMFRYERPQKGRMRQFHQINCECLGTDSPYADAELVCMLFDFLQDIKISSLKLKINSLGCKSCRPAYMEKLREFLSGIDPEELCEDCRTRIVTNPLRVLDCKHEKCKLLTANAPKLIEHNCENCRTHINKVLELLSFRNIDMEIDHRLVRGLDYYCRTTFEVVSDQIGAQTAVAGGGRYDGLVSQLGGEDVPGVGFACGMERLALLVPRPEEAIPDFYVFNTEECSSPKAFRIAEMLRAAGYSVLFSYQPASFKSLIRKASKSGAKFCIIIGHDEFETDSVTVKNMIDGSQTVIPVAELVEKISVLFA